MFKSALFIAVWEIASVSFIFQIYSVAIGTLGTFGELSLSAVIIFLPSREHNFGRLLQLLISCLRDSAMVFAFWIVDLLI